MGCCGLVTKSCPTLCNPMDCSPPSSSVHGIFQARTLEWVTSSYSRVSFWFKDQTHISLCLLCWQTDYLPLYHLGSPRETVQPTKPNTLGSVCTNSLVRGSVCIHQLSLVDLFYIVEYILERGDFFFPNLKLTIRKRQPFSPDPWFPFY